LDSKSPIDQEVINSLELPQIDEFIADEEINRFDELMKLLEAEGGVTVERNTRLVRGLDYYNGTCFEVKAKAKSGVNDVLGAS